MSEIQTNKVKSMQSKIGSKYLSTVTKLRSRMKVKSEYLRQNVPKNIFSKRNEFKVFENEVDVTPITLPIIPEYNSIIEKHAEPVVRPMPVTETQIGGINVFTTSTMTLQSQLHMVNISISQTIRSKDDKLYDESLMEFMQTDSLFKYVEPIPSELRPISSNYYVEFDRPKTPTTVKIRLTETPVFYLYEHVSETVLKDTEEGDDIEVDNEYYEYLTEGKGRIRKTINAETQTTISLQRTRSTNEYRNKRRDLNTYVTLWKVYDTYQGIEDTPKSGLQVVEPDEPGYEEYSQQIRKQLEEIVSSASFKNALIVMQRVLANNRYNEEQHKFRGYITQSPFRPDIEFKYTLDLLWTFKNHFTENHPVTSMHWNPGDVHILAVGYGQYYYHEHKTGKVFIWNIKNPLHPERERYYDVPVTALKFSIAEPSLLAVAFLNGTVQILDITTVDMPVLYQTPHNWGGSLEPIWGVAWLPPDEYTNDEYLMGCTNHGRVYRLMIGNDEFLVPFPMMNLMQRGAKVRGVTVQRACIINNVPITKNSAALLFTKHNVDKDVYYLSTDDGTVHKCTRHNLHHHISKFQAHEGPVTTCQFSPFCRKLFLTTGADWSIHIWIEDCNEPLLTLKKSIETIECAAWHPNNSTILAHLAGNEIYLWDILRRTYQPVSSHRSPANCRNTLVEFTKCGRNLVVGDIEGNVHIYSLKDMPFPPFYQSQTIKQTLRKNLVVRKDLLKKFNNILSQGKQHERLLENI